MIAQEAKYHPRCLVSLYNKVAVQQDKEGLDTTNSANHGIALAELLTYIDEARIDEDVAPVFKLANLLKLYSTRVEQLGAVHDIRPHLSQSLKINY